MTVASAPPAPPAAGPGTDGACRLETGVPGLDHLLDGGLVRGSSLLVEGPPGSGKSTLGVRFVHEGIVKQGEPALIIAFEEFPRQVYQEALGAGVDLRAHEEAGMVRVLWTPPARVLAGLTGRDDLVDRLVKQLGARRLLIDSITHFKRVTSSEPQLREVLATALTQLKLQGVTSFLVKELDSAPGSGSSFEEYLADASLRLYHEPAACSPSVGQRMIEVRKTRGQDHVAGRHPFELGPEGFVVHPRLLPRDVERRLGVGEAVRGRAATGLATLDDMLDGGVLTGTLNLVLGPSGAGKSLLAHRFLDAGLRRGEKVLLATLGDRPTEVFQQAARPGPDWAAAEREGQLCLVHVDPHEATLEKAQWLLLDAVERARPTRMVFDSIDDAWWAARDPVDVRQHVAVVAAIAAAANVTTLALARADEGPADPLPVDARLASCVLRLTVHHEGRTLARRLWVVKHRRSRHATEAVDYAVEEDGLRVLGPPGPRGS